MPRVTHIRHHSAEGRESWTCFAEEQTGSEIDACGDRGVRDGPGLWPLYSRTSHRKTFRRPQGTWSLSFLIHKMGAVTPAPWGCSERGQDGAVWGGWWGGLPALLRRPPGHSALWQPLPLPAQGQGRVSAGLDSQWWPGLGLASKAGRQEAPWEAGSWLSPLGAVTPGAPHTLRTATTAHPRQGADSEHMMPWALEKSRVHAWPQFPPSVRPREGSPRLGQGVLQHRGAGRAPRVLGTGRACAYARDRCSSSWGSGGLHQSWGGRTWGHGDPRDIGAQSLGPWDPEPRGPRPAGPPEAPSGSRCIGDGDLGTKRGKGLTGRMEEGSGRGLAAATSHSFRSLRGRRGRPGRGWGGG